MSKKRNLYLYMFLVALIISLLIDFILNSITRLPYPNVLFYGEELAFIATVLLTYFFWRYIKGSVDDQNPILIKAEQYIKIVVIISILIILSNMIYPFLFYISNNIIMYTAYTWVAYFFPFQIILISLYYVNKVTIDVEMKKRILV